MRFLGAVSLVAVTLVFSPPAQAKGVKSAVLCGVSECTRIATRLHDVVDGSLTGSVALAPREYYVVTVAYGGPNPSELTHYWVPDDRGPMFVERDVYEQENGWLTPHPAAARAYAEAAAELEPFPAPAFTDVRVDGKRVADPASYARLLELRQSDTEFPSDRSWQVIELRAKGDNPWSRARLHYAPRDDTVIRGASYVRLAPEVARLLERRLSLATEADRAPRLVPASMLAALVLVGALALARRRPRTA